MAGTWACRGCGRRVPRSVDTCRCGVARPYDFFWWMGWTAQDYERRAPYKLLGLCTGVLIVAVIYGTRSVDRWLTSREARAAAVEAVTKVAGAQHAESLVARHHLACFNQRATTAWERLQGSKFNRVKYVDCIVNAVQKDGAAMRK
jgi:hypothetical protein